MRGRRIKNVRGNLHFDRFDSCDQRAASPRDENEARNERHFPILRYPPSIARQPQEGGSCITLWSDGSGR